MKDWKLQSFDNFIAILKTKCYDARLMVRRALLAHHLLGVANHPEQVSPAGRRAEG